MSEKRKRKNDEADFVFRQLVDHYILIPFFVSSFLLSSAALLIALFTFFTYLLSSLSIILPLALVLSAVLAFALAISISAILNFFVYSWMYKLVKFAERWFRLGKIKRSQTTFRG